jgi:hypothetical protein
MEEVSEKPVSKQSPEHKAILERATKRLKLYDEVMGENDKAALEDIKFSLLGQQWSGDDLAAREGRPSLTANKLAENINQVVNEQRQAKQSIKVVGVDGKADKAVAKIETGVIRNIEYLSRADIAYETAYEAGVAGGKGFFGVLTCYADQDTFEQDIRIRTFENFLAVKFDCDSVEPDGSDGNWAFVEDRLSREEFEDEHGEYDTDAVPDSYAEAWHDDDHVYIREYWERTWEPVMLTLGSDGVTRKEGEPLPPGVTVVRKREAKAHKVKMYKLAGDRVLAEMDFPATYIPIFPVYGKRINVGGKVHIFGLTRFARDPQKMFNYWLSSIAEKIALAPKTPIMASTKMVEGLESIWNNLGTKAFPWVPFNPDPSAPGVMPQRLSTDADITGMMIALQQAEQNIQSALGIHKPTLGINEGNQSGRAILALQKQGDTSTFNYADNLARAKAQCGRVIVQLIGKLYDTERIVRVLGEDGEASLAVLNQEVPIPGGAMQKLNDVTVGKYDVEVTTGPSYATKRMETSQAMLDFMQAFPPAAPVIGKRLAKLQDWDGAEEIAQELEAITPGPQNPQLMVQQVAEKAKAALGTMQQQYEQKLKEAQDEQALKWAELKLKAQELKVKQDEAENKRLDALAASAMTDERVAGIVQTILADMQVDADKTLQDDLADAAMPEAMGVEMAEMPLETPPEMPTAPDVDE